MRAPPRSGPRPGRAASSRWRTWPSRPSWVAATTSRSCSARAALIRVAATRADRQPRPGGVEAVRRVERGDERGVPGDDRVRDGQAGGRRADVRHGGQVAAQRRGPGDRRPRPGGRRRRSRHRCAAVSSLLRAASAPRAWLPRASTWSASADRSASAASSCGVTSASPAAVRSGRAGVPGAWSMPVTMPAAPSAMATMIASQMSPPAMRPSGPRHPVGRRLVALPGPQVAEGALHRPRLEAEASTG